jgi:hypothetical protein
MRRFGLQFERSVWFVMSKFFDFDREVARCDEAMRADEARELRELR